VQEASRGEACCGVQATEVVSKGKVFLGGARHCHKIVCQLGQLAIGLMVHCCQFI